MKLPTLRQELILIVDDDASLRDTLEELLKAHNYNTLTASDGIEAIALYAQHRTEISIVLLDLMMALLDGATVIRVLQAMNSQVPVVAMSGLSPSEIGHFLDRTSVEAYLLKPFTTQEVLQTFQRVSTPKIGLF